MPKSAPTSPPTIPAGAAQSRLNRRRVSEHQVDGIGAHEQAERQLGRVARQPEEQRDAQDEPEEREVSACRRVWKPRASAEPRSSSAARESTKARGRRWTRTGIVIGDAPNPVMPNTRYAAKITSGTSSSTS